MSVGGPPAAGAPPGCASTDSVALFETCVSYRCSNSFLFLLCVLIQLWRYSSFTDSSCVGFLPKQLMAARQ